MTEDPAEIIELFKKLMFKIRSVTEEAGKRKVLFEFIRSQTPASFVEVFQLAFAPPESQEIDAELLRKVMASLLSEGSGKERLTYEEIAEFYREACERGYKQAAAYFLNLPPAKTMEETEKPVMHRSLSQTTLGMRRSLAKGQKKFVIDHLMLDADRIVIRNILRNPRITETDAIKMAAKRPAATEALEEIYKSPRWKNNYRVKKALVFNPYTPASISIKLVLQLLSADLTLCANSLNLHELVRQAAREEIERRKNAGVKKGDFESDVSVIELEEYEAEEYKDLEESEE